MSMNGTSTDRCLQASNPDISGIGVRLSFYLQNALLVILVDRSWQDAPSAIWTFVATSFGLTISAIIQAAQHSLSFYQALQVSNLVWLANFGTFFSLASYSRHRSKNHEKKRREDRDSPNKRKHRWSGTKMKLAAMFQTLFTMVLTIYVWAKDDVFNNTSDNNTSGNDTCILSPDDVHYIVFFGGSVRAKPAGQIVALVFSVLLMLGYILVSMYDWYFYVTRKRQAQVAQLARSLPRDEEGGTFTDDESDKRPPAVPQVTVTPVSRNRAPSYEAGVPMIPLGMSSSGMRAVPSQLSLPMRPPEVPRRKPSGEASPVRRPPPERGEPGIDPMFLGISILQVVVLVYFIAVTEVLIRKNEEHGVDSQWSFGQVLALVLVVPSILQVVEAFQEHGLKNVHRSLTKTVHRERHHERHHPGDQPTVSRPRPSAEGQSASLLMPQPQLYGPHS